MKNTKKIEETGISILKIALNGCELVDANIYENDKTPFTDGSLLLYDSSNHSNKHFEQDIRCQVKATTDITVKDKKKYRRLKRSVLEGYQKLGGQLLFVVWIDSLSNCQNNQIFYQNLNSLYISRLLKSGLKNPVIPLTEFPKDPDHQMNVLKQVAFDLNNIKMVHSLSKRKNFPSKLIIPSYMFNDNSFTETISNLENQELTTYAVYNDHPEPIGTFTANDIQKIEIGGKKSINFCNGMDSFTATMIARQGSKDEFPVITIITGAEGCLLITVEKKKETQKVILKTRCAKKLEDQITNIKIMRHLIDSPIFEIDGNKYDLSKNMQRLSQSAKDGIDRSVKILQTINKLSKKLGVDFYSGLEDKKTVDQINSILDFVNDYSHLDKGQLLMKIFKYKEGYIGIAGTCDNYWNFFDQNMEHEVVIYGSNQRNTHDLVEVNPYLLAIQYSYPITKYIGYNFQLIYDWFTNHKNKLDNGLVIKQAQSFAEILINYSMKDHQHSNEYLKQANSVLEILKYDKNDQIFLDHMLVTHLLGKDKTVAEAKRLIPLLQSKNVAIRIYVSYLMQVSIDHEDITKLTRAENEWLTWLGIIKK